MRTIKEYQLENCGILEPLPFYLSKIVRDKWTAWHKLWQNLGATENQIQCLILLDVETRIHEEAEEIEIWSTSYPRSLQTVWIGNNEQSGGQILLFKTSCKDSQNHTPSSVDAGKNADYSWP